MPEQSHNDSIDFRVPPQRTGIIAGSHVKVEHKPWWNKLDKAGKFFFSASHKCTWLTCLLWATVFMHVVGFPTERFSCGSWMFFAKLNWMKNEDLLLNIPLTACFLQSAVSYSSPYPLTSHGPASRQWPKECWLNFSIMTLKNEVYQTFLKETKISVQQFNQWAHILESDRLSFNPVLAWESLVALGCDWFLHGNEGAGNFAELHHGGCGLPWTRIWMDFGNKVTSFFVN